MEELEEKEFSKALTEVNFILKHTDSAYISKVPNSFRKFLDENEDKDYNPNIRFDVPLAKQKLQEQTRNVMAIIYRNYLCNEDEKKAFDKMLKENDKRLREENEKKYGYAKMFGNQKSEIQNEENVETKALMDYSKLKWYKKITCKVKIWLANLLKRNNYA